jgi:hypothetical protein
MRTPGLMLALLLCIPAAEAGEIANRDTPALIRALQQAGQSAQPERIQLHPDGLYTLSLTDSEGLALPPLRGRITIDGRGAEIRGWTHRPMHFLRVEPGADVLIRDLTLAEANDGALRNYGKLTLDRVIVSDSMARGETSILWNRGELLLRQSRIEFNLVHAPAGSAALLRNEGVLRLQNTRLEGNRVTGTQAHPLNAAALWNQGEVHAEAVSMHDNLLNDLFGGGDLPALVNVSGGQVSGHLLAR